MTALQPALDAAARRNVEVDVHVEPDLPVLPKDDVAHLTQVVSGVLKRRATAARLVLATVGSEIVVSIVCRGYDEEVVLGGDNGNARGRLEVLQRGGTVWVTVRYQVPTTPAGDVHYEFAA